MRRPVALDELDDFAAADFFATAFFATALFVSSRLLFVLALLATLADLAEDFAAPRFTVADCFASARFAAFLGGASDSSA